MPVRCTIGHGMTGHHKTVERMFYMTQNSTVSRLYFAIIIEENDQGFHRESLWYGGSPENLALTVIDTMSDWYEPFKDKLDESIVKYHEMLENKDELTFDKIAGEAFNADGMIMYVDMSNDLNVMFSFIVREICSIFGKEGETPESFASLAEFKNHFIEKYDIDQVFKDLLEGVNEATISNALVVTDMKYGYTARHFRSN